MTTFIVWELVQAHLNSFYFSATPSLALDLFVQGQQSIFTRQELALNLNVSPSPVAFLVVLSVGLWSTIATVLPHNITSRKSVHTKRRKAIGLICSGVTDLSVYSVTQ